MRELSIHERGVVSRCPVGFVSAEVRVPVGVRLDVDEAGRLHLFELVPSEGVTGVRDGRGVDEERDRNVALLDDREEDRVDGTVAVVYRDGDDGRGGCGSFAEDDVRDSRERNDGVVIRCEEVELRLEDGCGDGGGAGSSWVKAVIGEDGDAGVLLCLAGYGSCEYP